MNLKDIKASYIGEKRQAGKKDPWAHYIARPLSFFPACWLINRGVTATQVTIGGLAFGIAGCSLLYLGDYWAIVSGAFLVNIFGLSDYIDGNIARATNTVSEYGGRIDGVSYLIMLVLIFYSVGAGSGLLALGLLVALIRVLRYAITYQHQISAEPSKTNILYRIGMMVIGIRDPLLLVCAVVNMLPAFLLFYMVMHMGELMVVLMKVFKR